MPQPNLKILLVLSGILAVILIVVLIIPLGRKSVEQGSGNLPTPTTVAPQENIRLDAPTPTIAVREFTGVEDVPLPENVATFVNQKQDLRSKAPLTLSTFVIDFDYAEDKFTIQLNDPKDQALREFESWRNNNYPAVTTDQFIFR